MVCATKRHPRSNRITTHDGIIDRFCRVDTEMQHVPKHRQAHRYPSELVTLARLFALTGVGQRAFPRWRRRDYLPLFPKLPKRTRLFRLFATHRDGADDVLAEPTTLGVAASYGLEVLHPMREGRSEQQIGRNGTSNQRWIGGSKLAYIVNQCGLIVAWDCATANVYDAAFHPLVADCADAMVVLTDMGFHAQRDNPPHRKACPCGTWNVRMVVETVLAMLTGVCQLKKLSQRRWPAVLARLRFPMALFKLLVQWHEQPIDDTGALPLSIAEFSL